MDPCVQPSIDISHNVPPLLSSASAAAAIFHCIDAESGAAIRLRGCAGKNTSETVLWRCSAKFRASISALDKMCCFSLVRLTHAQALCSITAVSSTGPFYVDQRGSLSQVFTGNFHSRGPAPDLTQEAHRKRCPLRPWERTAGSAIAPCASANFSEERHRGGGGNCEGKEMRDIIMHGAFVHSSSIGPSSLPFPFQGDLSAHWIKRKETPFADRHECANSPSYYNGNLCSAEMTHHFPSHTDFPNFLTATVHA